MGSCISFAGNLENLSSPVRLPTLLRLAKQPISNRAKEDARLLRLIRPSFITSHGAPRGGRLERLRESCGERDVFCAQPGPRPMDGPGSRSSFQPSGLGPSYPLGVLAQHHAFPESARLGIARGELDPGWYVLRTFEKWCLASNLGVPRAVDQRDGLLKRIMLFEGDMSEGLNGTCPSIDSGPAHAGCSRVHETNHRSGFQKL
jgi:hypothetical protein